jgi:hypothetical protein
MLTAAYLPFDLVNDVAERVDCEINGDLFSDHGNRVAYQIESGPTEVGGKRLFFGLRNKENNDVRLVALWEASEAHWNEEPAFVIAVD